MALWKNHKDYGHGTGHGVGSFMNVHEGPQNIRKDLNPQVLLAGMVCSDEPGVYLENQYGIRHENLITVREVATNEPCNRERPGRRPGSSCLAVRSRLHKLPWCFLLTGAPETPQLTIVPPNRPSRREFRPHPP